MADYRTVLLFQTKPYGTWLTTVRYYYFKLRTVFPSRQGQFASLCTVRDSYSTRTETFLLNRTVLRFEIPYGISIARWEIYIATYRTGLSFEPYGITFIRPLRTTLHLSPVRDINLHRTVCSFSGFLIMFLSISRPYYNTKSS